MVWAFFIEAIFYFQPWLSLPLFQIEKHDQQMKDWKQFKGDREEARQYVEKMTNSAIIVQAWWRGLLVRLQLGPYRPKKKPKKAAKKKFFWVSSLTSYS